MELCKTCNRRIRLATVEELKAHGLPSKDTLHVHGDTGEAYCSWSYAEPQKVVPRR